MAAEIVWVWEPDGPDGTGFYATVISVSAGNARVRVVTRGTPPRRNIGDVVSVPAACVHR